MQQFLDQFDMDDDGRISFEEFTTALLDDDHALVACLLEAFTQLDRADIEFLSGLAGGACRRTRLPAHVLLERWCLVLAVVGV